MKLRNPGEKALTDTSLWSAWEWVNENNPVTEGYHTTQHMWAVMALCQYLSEFSTGQASKALVLAALFHDYDHSQGKSSDEVNICKATAVMLQWSEDNGIEAKVAEEAVSIIKATQYPYVIESKNLTLAQATIRDADVLYGLLHPQYAIELAGEMGIPLSKLVEERTKFLDSIEMNSKAGQAIFGLLCGVHLRELKTYIELHSLEDRMDAYFKQRNSLL